MFVYAIPFYGAREKTLGYRLIAIHLLFIPLGFVLHPPEEGDEFRNYVKLGLIYKIFMYDLYIKPNFSFEKYMFINDIFQLLNTYKKLFCYLYTLKFDDTFPIPLMSSLDSMTS